MPEQLGLIQAPPVDEFNRKRNQKQIEAILKSVEGKRIRHASPKQFEPCPTCQTAEHIMGHWQGSVLVMLCMLCGKQGVRITQRARRVGR